jgi:hypothetical protein
VLTVTSTRLPFSGGCEHANWRSVTSSIVQVTDSAWPWTSQSFATCFCHSAPHTL